MAESSERLFKEFPLCDKQGRGSGRSLSETGQHAFSSKAGWTFMPTQTLRSLIQKVAGGATLTEDEIRTALELMTEGVATQAQMGAFLMALRVRGETVGEITGAARMMRSRMLTVEVPADTIDVVGTGGDAHGTYNISTCSALVVAGTGVHVAKHGNRSVSSKAGASDVLQALGVKLDVGPDVVARSVREAGVGFMWAPMHHPAMKHWAPVRAELGIRTIFNVLGPISNPAGVKRQIVGVYARALVEPIAHVVNNLGCTHVWVVHGHDGMDELTTTGPTQVAEVKGGRVHMFDVLPSDAGLPTATMADLQGGDAATNAAAIRDVLAGKPGPFRNIVLLNAAAALIIAGKAQTLPEGVVIATKSIDSGAALSALERLIAVTNAAT